jgi:hypothetical protein
VGGSTSLSLCFLGHLIYTWSHHILWGLWQLFCSVSYIAYIGHERVKRYDHQSVQVSQSYM